MKSCHASCLIFLLLGNTAFASGPPAEIVDQSFCPPGYYPSGPSFAYTCVSINGDNEEEASSRSLPSEQSRIRGHLEPAWGALVWDPEMLVADYKNSLYFGVAMGSRSKQAAIDRAMSQCENDGGKKCQIQATVTNGCLGLAGAIDQLVWAVEYHDGKSILGTSDRAGKKALAKCNAKGYEKCEIIYHDCSISNWVSG